MILLTIIIGIFVYATIGYLPVAATPVISASALPKKVEEQPKFLFSLGDNARGKIKQPISVVTGKDGRIFVTDAGDYNVKIYLPNGRFYKSFGKKGPGKTGFGYPYGIDLLKNGDIVVADSVNQNVRVFSESGSYKRTLLDAKQKIRPGALVTDDNGQIYISDLMNHQIVVLSSAGKLVRKIKPTVTALKYPQELMINHATKNLWVADSGNFAVKEINSTGQVTATINKWGSPAQAFTMVRGMAVDNLNRLMVADTLSGTIHVLSSDGKDLFSFDGKGSPAGNLVYPSFIHIDSAGKIYIADRGTGLVQVWGFKKSK